MVLTPTHHYFLYRKATDMRKSFDGLYGLVRTGLRRDPLSGKVFVFINRRRTQINNQVKNAIRPIALGGPFNNEVQHLIWMTAR